MFTGFREFSIAVDDDVEICGRIGGDGPPLLLLHGFPQTHVMWHHIAPDLARDFTVIATDLRGYGASSKPVTGPDGAGYSKRQMAEDQLAVMHELGFDRFSVVGHDRGARCSYRLALDHPESVQRIAVLDIVPTLDALARTDASVAMRAWHWFFLAQPHPLPENLIAATPDDFFFGKTRDLFAPEALEAYREAVSDPETVRAMCDDYRAMVTHDLHHDEADFGQRKITSPLLALWGKRSNVDQWYDVPAVWQRWATDVSTGRLDCGHFLAEEAPTETYEQLHAFLT